MMICEMTVNVYFSQFRRLGSNEKTFFDYRTDDCVYFNYRRKKQFTRTIYFVCAKK